MKAAQKVGNRFGNTDSHLQHAPNLCNVSLSLLPHTRKHRNSVESPSLATTTKPRIFLSRNFSTYAGALALSVAVLHASRWRLCAVRAVLLLAFLSETMQAPASIDLRMRNGLKDDLRVRAQDSGSN